MNSRLLEKNFNKIALSVSTIILASTVLISPVSAQQVITDGQSRTTVYVSGNTTDIKTHTIKGSNAYNTFQKFDVYKGNTVNLHVPESAQNLVNLIYDEKTNIDGILNGLKNGKVGGNIFLINPHGITVGTEGVINVGSLTATTPDPEMMKRFDINSLEAYSDSYQNLGLNNEAIISVKGRINATKSVYLNAGSVIVSGNINAGTDQNNDIIGFNDESKPQSVGFGEIVNIGTSLKPSITIKNDNGNIKIHSVNAVKMDGGRLLSNGGDIDISAGYIFGYGQIQGNLSAKTSTIQFTNTYGDLVINNIDSFNTVNLWSNGSILPSNNTNASHFIKGQNITLNSLNGNIGTEYNPFKIVNMMPSQTKLSARANWGSIYLKSLDRSDVLVDQLEARNNISLEAYGNIFDGSRYNSMPNITAQSINLSSETGSIGEYNRPIKTASSMPGYGYYYKPSTEISVKANKNVIIEQNNHDIKINSIKSNNGTVKISTNNGSILDNDSYDNSVNIDASSIQLEAKNGSIGSKYADIKIGKSDNSFHSLNASALDGEINITNIKGDIYLGVIESYDDVKISSDGSILDGHYYELPNVAGKNITLHSDNGSIGSKTDNLDVESNRFNSGGSLTVTAPKGNINIKHHDYDLYIKKIQAGGDIAIESEAGIYSASNGSTRDIMGNDIILTAGTVIGSSNNPLGIMSRGNIKTKSSGKNYIMQY